MFVPGYRDDRQSAAGPGDDASRPGSAYGWAGSASGKGPVRGFPPAPGQPPPLYPPGQFAAWNRTAEAAADMRADDGWPASLRPEGGHARSGRAEPAEPGRAAAADDYPDAGFVPGYSALAVSDPAADVTSTQTWGAVSDGRGTGAWRDPGAPGGDQGASGASTRTRQPAGGGTPADALPRRRAAGEPGGPRTPARGYPAQADGASGPGTQPGRARGHGTGAHSTRTGPHARIGSRPGPRGKLSRGKLSRGLLAAGIAVLAVLVVLGGGSYVLLRGSHGGRGGQAAATPAAKSALQHPSPAPSGSSPAQTSPPGPWGHIESRAADPQPLTLAEVFPATFAAGASFSRTVRRKGTNCAKAVVGGKLRHAVRRPGCSQVLRASYLSASRKLMGTIGVLNLKTFTAAERAGKAAGRAQFIEQLAAAKGPTRNLTKGTGIEEALVKGHYLILVWAEFTTLHKPKTKKQRSELETFMTQLIQKTANVSLTSRMVTGKP